MCDCAKDINKSLQPHNYKLTRNLLEEDPPVLVEIHKIERKKRTPSMSCVATFCPFCGNRYPSRKSRGVFKSTALSSQEQTHD